MLELNSASPQHITQEEVVKIQQTQFQKPGLSASPMSGNFCSSTSGRGGSMSPDPSMSNNTGQQTIMDLKKRYRYKVEMDKLSGFMLKNFCAGALIKYSRLFVPVEFDSKQGKKQTCKAPAINLADLMKFVKILLTRVKATRHQFKKMCILSIKFFEACVKSRENYMKYLKYDVRKVVVACLALTYPQGHTMANTEKSMLLVSSAAGVSNEQLRHCCEIVGPILKSEFLKKQRQQYQTAHAQAQTGANESNHASQNNTASMRGSIATRTTVNIRSTDFGTFTNCYTNQDDQETYLTPSDYESFNEMGKQMVNRTFLVKL